MNQRLILTAVAVVVMILAVVFMQRSNRPDAEVGVGERMLPSLEDRLQYVNRLQATGQGEQSTLQRVGDQWTIAERGGYRADRTEVIRVLRALATADTIEQATAQAAYHSRLGLADPESPTSRGVILEVGFDDDQAEQEPLMLIVGDAAQGRDGCYARLASDPQSWLINPCPRAPAAPQDWINAAVIDLNETVRSLIRTKPDDGSFEANRASREQATLELGGDAPSAALSFPGVIDASARTLLNMVAEDVRPSAEQQIGDTQRVDTELQLFNGISLIASAYEYDGHKWVQLAATVAESRPADDTELVDQVSALNDRFDGWAFQVSDYTYGELTKGLQAYLRAPDHSDEETDAN